MKTLHLALSVLLIGLSFFVTSCGGGGGGDDTGDFSGGARAVLSLSPTTVDVGDRVRVTLDVIDVNTEAIVVKFRYPDSLTYVGDTATLEVGKNEEDLTPDFNEEGNNRDRFLVFFLEEDNFDREEQGKVVLSLQANDGVTSGEIEVDIDADDPLIPNDEEFSVEDPQFQAEDAVQIDVRR